MITLLSNARSVEMLLSKLHALYQKRVFLITRLTKLENFECTIIIIIIIIIIYYCRHVLQCYCMVGPNLKSCWNIIKPFSQDS